MSLNLDSLAFVYSYHVFPPLAICSHLFSFPKIAWSFLILPLTLWNLHFQFYNFIQSWNIFCFSMKAIFKNKIEIKIKRCSLTKLCYFTWWLSVQIKLWIGSLRFPLALGEETEKWWYLKVYRLHMKANVLILCQINILPQRAWMRVMLKIFNSWWN